MDNYSPSSTDAPANSPDNPPENADTPTATAPPRLTRPQRYLRRLGCFVIFIVWLGCMTLPCFFVTLMVEGEVVHQWSDRPGHEVRVFRLEDSEAQGFGLSQGSLQDETDSAYCVSTTTRYLVWEGEAQSLDYCECYAKTDDTWEFAGAYQADCHSELEFDLETDTE